MVLSFNSIFGGNAIEHNFVSKSLILIFFQKSGEPLFVHIFDETHEIIFIYFFGYVM
jgi:hypothetical protein